MCLDGEFAGLGNSGGWVVAVGGNKGRTSWGEVCALRGRGNHGGGRAVSLGGAERNMHGPPWSSETLVSALAAFIPFWARHDPSEERDTCERLSVFYIVLGAT